MPNILTPLPDGYQPHTHDVIIGRGKRVNTHNERNTILQFMLISLSAEYIDCTKERKSDILNTVLREIQRHSNGGGFIKKAAGKWSVVDDPLARSTVAQFLRNHVPDNFKSSKQFKKKMRGEKKAKPAPAAAKVTPMAPAIVSSVVTAPPSPLAALDSEQAVASRSSILCSSLIAAGGIPVQQETPAARSIPSSSDALEFVTADILGQFQTQKESRKSRCRQCSSTDCQCSASFKRSCSGTKSALSSFLNFNSLDVELRPDSPCSLSSAQDDLWMLTLQDKIVVDVTDENPMEPRPVQEEGFSYFKGFLEL